MNDAPASVDQKARQGKTDEGKRILKRIEKGFLTLHDLIGVGCTDGMMDICECHELQNKAMELHYATLGLHTRLTAVAKRNGCDVPDGGEVTTRGGPGR